MPTRRVASQPTTANPLTITTANSGGTGGSHEGPQADAQLQHGDDDEDAGELRMLGVDAGGGRVDRAGAE